MAITYNNSVVRDGLVLYLDAANIKSYSGTGTVWNDLSGNGNNGTLFNGPTYSNSIITFDGVDDYVTCSKPVLTTFTLSFWGKLLSNASSNYPWIFLAGSDFIGFFGSTTSATFRASLNNGSYTEIRSTSINPGLSFNMYSLLYNGTTVSLNVNGIPQTSTMNLSGFGMLSSTTLRFGTNGTVDRASSSISNVQLYNRALSVNEIQQNFNALRGRYNV